MALLITGVAGFVGANLARRMLQRGESIGGIDNLCRGSMRNLDSVLGHPNFAFELAELADIGAYRRALGKLNSRFRISEVWHLAASSDIPAGAVDPGVDLRDTFMTTYNTLMLMRELGIRIIAFSSSSAVYGNLGDRRLTEEAGPLFPISNYGAMKLASEAAISAALESSLDQAFIFRFPNVVGVPATHGVILDFVHKLTVNPGVLEVLGDGTQRKPYLHVHDLVDAMLYIRECAPQRLNYYNIGPDDTGATVRFIAEQVVRRVSPSARITFGEGDRGWVGDVPRFSYETRKLANLGWKSKMNSEQAISMAIDQVADQEKV